MRTQMTNQSVSLALLTTSLSPLGAMYQQHFLVTCGCVSARLLHLVHSPWLVMKSGHIYFWIPNPVYSVGIGFIVGT